MLLEMICPHPKQLLVFRQYPFGGWRKKARLKISFGINVEAFEAACKQASIAIKELSEAFSKVKKDARTKQTGC